MEILNRYYDNSLENIGNSNSFVWYGPRWAQAATAPGKLYKMYSNEGGIRVPCVVRYPPLFPAGQLIKAFASVMDITPTLLQFAGVEHPVSRDKSSGMYQDREVYGLRGNSWLPFFHQLGARLGRDAKSPAVINGTSSWSHHGEKNAEEMAIYGPEEFAGWELYGRAALRMGPYKIVFGTESDFGKNRWELYDVVKDPGETIDLAENDPEKLKDMIAAWDRYVKETGTVWGIPIAPPGASWQGTPADSVGGDPIAETRAWTAVGNDEMLS